MSIAACVIPANLDAHRPKQSSGPTQHSKYRVVVATVTFTHQRFLIQPWAKYLHIAPESVGTVRHTANLLAYVRTSIRDIFLLFSQYGGDISRKMKLLKRQAEGKKKMRRIGNIEVPKNTFIKILQRWFSLQDHVLVRQWESVVLFFLFQILYPMRFENVKLGFLEKKGMTEQKVYFLSTPQWLFHLKGLCTDKLNI